MEITEKISSGPASEKEIQSLEASVGCKLPPDYRRFLATDNGGRPSPRVFVVQGPQGPSNDAIQAFFTLDGRAKYYFIDQERAVYKDRMPSGLLPIACDAFGNLILLDVGARVVGTIYFWDHEQENMDEPTWENISLVASSFQQFVDSLQ